ncbi:MAG: hypothetical protein HY877_00095 [Deltaproteobacteria bacterium]|nr:hypothetical protein [Deltaproteobacteria bacterium]
MSAILPLEMVMPSWLEVGANSLEFATAVAQLEQGLDGLVTFGAGTPEASVVTQLRDIFIPGQTQRSPENLRQLLFGIAHSPEGTKVFAAAMTHARAQAGAGWVEPTRRRFATDPPTFPQQTVQAERVVQTQLRSFGELFVVGKQRATFPKHASESVSVRMIGDVVVGVDFLKDGPPSPKPQKEFTLIYQDGKLVDSVFHGISSPRMAKLQSAVVKIYLNRFGHLSLGGRRWGTFSKYGNYPVEAEIRNGIVVEVRILKPSVNLLSAKEVVDGGTREFSLIYDEKGMLVNSFNNLFEREDWQTMTNHTIVIRLDTNGLLHIGGESRGAFTKHPGEIIVIRVRENQIMQVLILNAAKIKEVDVSSLTETSPTVREAHDYSLIYNGSSVLKQTFPTALTAQELQRLKDHVVITSLSSDGTLTLGGIKRAQIQNHPNGVVAVEIKNGVIVKIKLLKATHLPDVKWPLQEKDIKRAALFHLVWDAHGQRVDSFYQPWDAPYRRIPVRFQNHLGKITGDFRVDSFNGFLHGNKRYYFGDNVDYRGWPLSEIVFEDTSHPGEITEFLIVNPATGETIHLDAREYRQELGDIASWVIEVVPPAKEEKAIGNREPRSVLRIGPRTDTPE